MYLICEHIFLITFLNESEIFYTKINGFKFCYITVRF